MNNDPAQILVCVCRKPTEKRQNFAPLFKEFLDCKLLLRALEKDSLGSMTKNKEKEGKESSVNWRREQQQRHTLPSAPIHHLAPIHAGRTNAAAAAACCN